MVKKTYPWVVGATLDAHTQKKHTILSEYFQQYLLTRCQLPQQEKFNLIVVDGFCGAGRYKCGKMGSPLIFLDVLNKTLEEINIDRANQGMRLIQIDCLLFFNDLDQEAIEELKKNVLPFQIQAKENTSKLNFKIEFSNSKFDEQYPIIKKKILSARCKNVLFNLDQCGYSHVNPALIRDIIQSWRSAEIFLNFPISTIKTYLSENREKNRVPLDKEIENEIFAHIEDGNHLINKPQWLGFVEKLIFENLKSSAPYVSPFSIHNPNGWGYWLMHFANSYRARQVYNNILHANSSAQAHFGSSGLKMLSFNPEDENSFLYKFDDGSRMQTINALHEDIPRLISEFGDTIGMNDFCRVAYSETPAHSKDIHEVLIENEDIEVITENGGERRSSKTITTTDTLKLKSQRSWFSMFPKEN